VHRLISALLLFIGPPLAAARDFIPHQVVWTSPSKESLDSMPLSGRLGAGANVWVQDGSVWLYLGHSGAFNSQGILNKLGCVRITPVGIALGGGSGFQQELDPATGTITVRQDELELRLWFAADTLLVESATARPMVFDVAYASWRDQRREGVALDLGGSFTVEADHIVADADGFGWHHRNAEHPRDTPGVARGQSIPAEALWDPIATRVFGGAVAVAGGLSDPVATPVRWQLWDGKAWTGRTASREKHRIAIALRAARDGDPAAWRKQAAELLDPAVVQTARADELARWNEFWSRSHVRINPDAPADDSGRLVGRNYTLFRYMLACNRGGEFPLLFNGGIFTTDVGEGRITHNTPKDRPDYLGPQASPDARRWLGCYFMSQNQRWLGWPNLANGDADLFLPSLHYYRDRSPAAAARARNLGAQGVVWPEPLDAWGLCSVAATSTGLCGAPHLNYHFSMGLEHAWMAVQARENLGISLEKDLPWIVGVLDFYDSFYRAETKKRSGRELGPDGKLLIYPGSSLEYAGDATNPVEVVSGLRALTAGLLRLPEISEETRLRVERIQATLPEIPTGIREGRRSILVARSYTQSYNKSEPNEMYAMWPYRQAGVTRPETIQLARDTWDSVPQDRALLCKEDFSWMANLANMASVASPEKAKQRAIYKMANPHPQARFTAFFGPGHDWIPDHNWGGSGMTGIQEMLLAPEPGSSGKLHLFPAWPAEWDVDFKLHAPGKTLVEASLKGGRIVSLKVTPGSREKDIVNWLGKHPDWKAPSPPSLPLSQGKAITASSQFHNPGYDPAMANDGDAATRWSSSMEARSGWLAIDLGEERSIGSVRLSEVEWQETREFAIEIREGDGWKEVARGGGIGPDLRLEFPVVRAREIRLHVLKSAMPININEFQVFGPLAD